MAGSNKTIDFSKIEEFFKNYSGQVYKKEDQDKKLAGSIAYKQYKNFIEKIEFNELIISDHPKWQIRNNPGTGIKAYCASFFWVQFKEEKHKNEPYSISVFWKLNENNQLKLSVQTEIKNTDVAKATNEKKQEYINNFSKSSKIIPNGFERNEYDIDNTEYSKCVLEKEIDLNQNIDDIIYNTKTAIKNLIPNYKAIFDKQKGEPTVQNDNNKSNIPLNQILYGPPGTGKTYNTVIKAMEIIDSKKYTDNNGNLLKTVKYDDLKRSFYKAKKEHRIEFITFHQSYSYEEFVEGIKPYIKNDIWNKKKEQIDLEIKTLPDIKYIGQKGIFREICGRAESEICDRVEKISSLPFEDIYKEFKIQYPGDSNISWGKYQYKISYNSEGSLTDNTKAHTSIPTDKLKTFFDADKIENFASPTELQKYAETNEISTNGMQNSTFVAIKLMRNIRIPYVLIIDEINRGNISKIFGELITLIEEDKRKKVYEDGKEYNTLEVTLPYSQEPFYVPNNLYIIGTMNTADRSIASVDIALRRRFRFVEMLPKPNLLKIDDNELVDVVRDSEKQYKINLEKLLTVLNDRISYILDDDHQIGHSYFLKLLQSKDGQISEKELTDVFKYEILPLLNEYFYGDWEKIKAVLVRKPEADKEDLIGKSFVEKKANPNLSCYCGDKIQYKFRKFDNEFSISNAIACIAKGIITPEPIFTKKETPKGDSQNQEEA